MKIKNHIFTIFACCVLAVLVVSCKPKQQMISAASLVQDKANSELFTDLLNNEFRFSTLSSKLNMELISGTRSLSSRANLKIVNGRALQISIQPLFGVEMFRLHVDVDTLVLLDRMNKRYVKESLASLKEVYPVGFDYYSLQSLFANALFITGKENKTSADYSDFQYSQSSDLNYHLRAADSESGIEYEFTVNGNDRITFAHLMQPSEKYSLQWAYNNFASVEEQFFPHKMDIIAGTSSRKIEVGLLFSDIITNNPMELNINVPSGYTQVTLSEILKIISGGK